MKPKWKPHDDPKCICNGCMTYRPEDEMEAFAREMFERHHHDSYRTFNAAFPATIVEEWHLPAITHDPGDEDSSR